MSRLRRRECCRSWSEGVTGMATQREVAWRVFAGEFNSSDLEHSSGEERSPSYVVTPLGAKVNRMMVVGVLTDLENAGTDAEPMWRGRVSDPTGIFYVSAGQYQPAAAAALSRMKAPCFITVIGKSRVYRPEGGGIYLSIRPEVVRPADEPLRSLWVLQACRSLKTRIGAMEDALGMASPNAEQIRALGYPENIGAGVMLALPHYREKLDLERYKAMLKDALRFIAHEKRFATIEDEMEDAESEVSDTDEEKRIAREIGAQDGAKDGGAAAAAETGGDNEQRLLAAIAALDTTPKGVSYEHIQEVARKEKIGKEELEELFEKLLDKGLIYEPILGRVKLVKGK